MIYQWFSDLRLTFSANPRRRHLYGFHLVNSETPRVCNNDTVNKICASDTNASGTAEAIAKIQLNGISLQCIKESRRLQTNPTAPIFSYFFFSLSKPMNLACIRQNLSGQLPEQMAHRFQPRIHNRWSIAYKVR